MSVPVINLKSRSSPRSVVDFSRLLFSENSKLFLGLRTGDTGSRAVYHVRRVRWSLVFCSSFSWVVRYVPRLGRGPDEETSVLYGERLSLTLFYRTQKGLLRVPGKKNSDVPSWSCKPYSTTLWCLYLVDPVFRRISRRSVYYYYYYYYYSIVHNRWYIGVRSIIEIKNFIVILQS